MAKCYKKEKAAQPRSVLEMGAAFLDILHRNLV